MIVIRPQYFIASSRIFLPRVIAPAGTAGSNNLRRCFVATRQYTHRQLVLIIYVLPPIVCRTQQERSTVAHNWVKQGESPTSSPLWVPHPRHSFFPSKTILQIAARQINRYVA